MLEESIGENGVREENIYREPPPRQMSGGEVILVMNHRVDGPRLDGVAVFFRHESV